MGANRTFRQEGLLRPEEMKRRIVRGGVDDVRRLQRRIERGRPERSPARERAADRHAPPPDARVAMSEWELARARTGQATYRRIRAAIRAAAVSGEETLLTGSTELPAHAALAYAEQCLAFEGKGAVEVAVAGAVLRIHPVSVKRAESAA
jgi:hypothetical protein